MIGDQGKRKLISMYLIIALVILGFAGFLVFQSVIEENCVEAATTRYVGSGQTHTTIGTAITAANAGDTIRVYAGTYNENVVISKKLTIIGNGSTNTTINGGGSGDVVRITADLVNISGFNITNSGNQVLPNYDAGIDVDYAENVTIENVNCSKNSIGIRPNYSNSTTIINCTISSNSREGIYSRNSHLLRIINNTIYSNSRWGIFIGDSNHNIIENNNCTNNVFDGLDLWRSSFSSARNNTFINNPVGLGVYQGHDNVIKNNTFIDNNRGIHFSGNADNNLIANNFFNTTTFNDIHLSSSSSNTVENNSCLSHCSSGVYITGGFSSSNIIRNNTITNKSIGIHMITTNWTIIENNNCSNNYNAIYLQYTEFSKIANNTCNSTTDRGIYFFQSDSNTIVNNTVSGNEYGIFLQDSKSNTFSDNYMVNTGIIIQGDELGHWNSHAIDTSNFVNYKPVYYWKDKTSGNVPLNAGQIILANSGGVQIKNHVIGNTIVSLQLGFSNNITIDNNNFSSNIRHGIYSYNSHYNTITNNICKFSNDTGILFKNSDWNTFFNNNCSKNKNGIGFDETSKSNTISHNDCFENRYDGILLILNSDLNIIDNNTCNLNDRYGLYMFYTKSNTIENNMFISNNISGVQFNRSNSNIIKNNNCSNNKNGIFNNGNDWSWGNYNYVINNTCSGNDEYGIASTMADKNRIVKNVCSNNNIGIYMGGCNENHLYYNSILNNNIQAEQNSNDYWNNSDLEGNYWSDYTGLDNGANGRAAGDGIGDTSIPHPTGCDNYPFILPNGWTYPSIPTLFNPGELDSDGDYTISWNWSRGVKRYVLEEDVSYTFNSPTVVYDGSELSHEITGKGDGIYLYRIMGFNEQLESGWSNIEDITIDLLPEIPKNFSVTVYPEGNVLNLSWSLNIVDTKEYDIFIKIKDNWEYLTTINPPKNTYNHTGLEDGTQYSYKILARDYRGQNSSFSDVFAAIPQDSVAPKAPIGLDAFAISNTEIILTWEANKESDLVGYLIYFNSEGMEPETFLPIHEVKDMGTSYTARGLSEQVTYKFKLIAYDEVPNKSEFSEIVSATTLDRTPPQAPTGLTVSDPTNNSLTLSWEANLETDVVGYYIYYSVAQSIPFEPVTIESIEETKFVHTGLAEDTKYYYKLKARDNAYQSSQYSEIAFGITLLGQYPPEIDNPKDYLEIFEDTTDDTQIDLNEWFMDINNDLLTFRFDGETHINVSIEQETGKVVLKPEEDWNGEETITFYASDSIFEEIFYTITIKVLFQQDPPGPATITSPKNEFEIVYGTPLNLEGACDDPDLQYGDELEFKWFSKIDGELGDGKTLNDIVLSPGRHAITLEVRDYGDALAKDMIVVNVVEKPVAERTQDKPSYFLIGIIIIVLVIIIIAFFLIYTKKKRSEISKGQEELETQPQDVTSDISQIIPPTQQPAQPPTPSLTDMQVVTQKPPTTPLEVPGTLQPELTQEAEKASQIEPKPDSELMMPSIMKPMLPPAAVGDDVTPTPEQPQEPKATKKGDQEAANIPQQTITPTPQVTTPTPQTQQTTVTEAQISSQTPATTAQELPQETMSQPDKPTMEKTPNDKNKTSLEEQERSKSNEQ